MPPKKQTALGPALASMVPPTAHPRRSALARHNQELCENIETRVFQKRGYAKDRLWLEGSLVTMSYCLAVVRGISACYTVLFPKVGHLDARDARNMV
jgi:hypothetical protein